MKIILRSLSVLLIIVMNSCQSDEELLYSCDEKVDEFIKDNKLDLENMNIEHFGDLNIQIQKASFRMFCPERKMQLWNDKYDLLLDKNPDKFSSDELDHLERLGAILKLELFLDTRDSTVLSLANSEAREWADKAKSCFSWDQATLQYLLSSFFISKESYDAYMTNRLAHARPSASARLASDNSEYGCDCNYLEGFWLRDCGFALDCQLNMTCSVLGSSTGCGLLWLGACNGECIL